jgi:aspartyl-tRNA(Asn)/glutamyl-tRNA(Gln) amidotransferase subunit B
MSYETIIGLEIHIQLNTESKSFCSDFNRFDDDANTNISHISLAHPGTLPRMNTKHIEKAVKLGLAFDCQINEFNFFDRKNYFYPDLPKGYQITQDKEPYCRYGQIRYVSEGVVKSIRLHHIHMEEDAGKSIHDQHDVYTLVDYNRSGVPLLEIVTEPDFRSGQEVSDFMAELQKVVQYLEISDANMEEGSFRCDCNVSVRKMGESKLGERCEIKNMNSRRYAKQAIEYEALRQIGVIETGGIIHKTTMLFDPISGHTRPMRKKESENDYRYFPEPDLPPVMIQKELLQSIKMASTTLPIDLYLTFVNDYQLSHPDAELLTESKETAEFFIKGIMLGADPKSLCDILTNKLIPHCRKEKISLSNIGDIHQILDFVIFINGNKISKSAAYQHVFPEWIQDTSQNPEQIAKTKNLLQSDDQSFLDGLIMEVMTANEAKVAEYRKGKKGLLGFFMGQVMQKSGGKADPKILQLKVEAALN